MEIFLIAAWEIWKIRNRSIFYGVHATYSRWLVNFKNEASLQAHHLNDDDRLLVNSWVEAL